MNQQRRSAISHRPTTGNMFGFWPLALGHLLALRPSKNLASSPIFHTCLVFIGFFLLYLSTAPRTNVSYADSDLLITVGYQLGVAHPPGYILYTILVYFITHSPIPGTIAFRAHLLSITLHSLSLSFIFLACFTLIQSLGSQKKRTKLVSLPSAVKSRAYYLLLTTYYLIVAYAATLALGTSFLYWLYGTIAEKYALNDLFISIVIYLIVSLFSFPQTFSKTHHRSIYHYSLALILITGLGITYHQTFLLTLPATFLALLFSFSSLKPHWRAFLLTFLISLTTPVILLVYVNSRQVPISWHFEPTLTGLVTFLSRKELSGYLLIQGRYRGIYFDPVNLPEIIHKIPIYADILIDHFGLVSLSLYLFGVFSVVVFIYRQIQIYLSNHKLSAKLSLLHPQTLFDSLAQISSSYSAIYLILLTFTLCTTVFIPMYLDWPTDISDQSLRIRQYLAGYPVIAIFITLALHQLSQKIKHFQFRLLPIHPELCRRTTYYLLPISFLVFLLIFRLPSTYHQLDLHDFTFVHRFYSQQLQKLPPNTLLACTSDTACFASVYAQQIDGLRPDIIIVPHATRIFETYLNSHSNLKGFNNPENPELYLDYLSWNQDKHPVYVLELQKFYYDLLGMNYNLVSYIPRGYLGQISTKAPSVCSSIDSTASTITPCLELPTASDYSFSQELIHTHFPSIDQTRQQLKASLAQKHLLNVMTYQRYLSTLVEIQSRDRQNITLLQTAINQEMALASQLVTDLPSEYQQQVADVQKLLPSLAFDQYVPGVSHPTQDQILDQANQYLQQKNAYLAVVGVNSVLFHDPLDLTARLQLAHIYQTTGDTTSAQQQLQNVIKYDPTNPKALDLLKQTQL